MGIYLLGDSCRPVRQSAVPGVLEENNFFSTENRLVGGVIPVEVDDER